MQLWIVEHFFLQKKVHVVLYRYLFVKKKVFNYSELHFSEVTSYKIHTLEYLNIMMSLVNLFFLSLFPKPLEQTIC